MQLADTMKKLEDQADVMLKKHDTLYCAENSALCYIMTGWTMQEFNTWYDVFDRTMNAQVGFVNNFYKPSGKMDAKTSLYYWWVKARSDIALKGLSQLTGLSTTVLYRDFIAWTGAQNSFAKRLFREVYREKETRMSSFLKLDPEIVNNNPVEGTVPLCSIDCTEVHVNGISTADGNASLFSNYKQAFTHKFLIALDFFGKVLSCPGAIQVHSPTLIL